MSNSTEAQGATRSRAPHQCVARSVCSFVEPSNIQHSALETVMTPSGGDFIFFTWQLRNSGSAPNKNRLPIGSRKRPKHVMQHRGPPQYRLQVNMLVGCAAAQLACISHMSSKWDQILFNPVSLQAKWPWVSVLISQQASGPFFKLFKASRAAFKAGKAWLVPGKQLPVGHQFERPQTINT